MGSGVVSARVPSIGRSCWRKRLPTPLVTQPCPLKNPNRPGKSEHFVESDFNGVYTRKLKSELLERPSAHRGDCGSQPPRNTMGCLTFLVGLIAGGPPSVSVKESP